MGWGREPDRGAHPCPSDQSYMTLLKNLALLFLFLSLSLCSILLTIEARKFLHSWSKIPQQLTLLQHSLDLLPAKVLPPVLSRVDALTSKADRQLTAMQKTLDRRAGETLDLTDKRTGEALKLVDGRTQDLVAQVAGLRSDLKPTLDNTAALVKDGQDSLDDLYPDIRSLLESAEVTTTQTAQTLEVVREAAPKMAEAAISIDKSVDGITKDVHKATSDFVKPKTFWGKVKGWIGLTGEILARRI